jgi:hypothetical protein
MQRQGKVPAYPCDNTWLWALFALTLPAAGSLLSRQPLNGKPHQIREVISRKSSGPKSFF